MWKPMLLAAWLGLMLPTWSQAESWVRWANVTTDTIWPPAPTWSSGWMRGDVFKTRKACEDVLRQQAAAVAGGHIVWHDATWYEWWKWGEAHGVTGSMTIAERCLPASVDPRGTRR